MLLFEEFHADLDHWKWAVDDDSSERAPEGGICEPLPDDTVIWTMPLVRFTTLPHDRYPRTLRSMHQEAFDVGDAEVKSRIQDVTIMCLGTHSRPEHPSCSSKTAGISSEMRA